MEVKKFESVRAPGHWLQIVEAGPPDASTLVLCHGAAGSWRNYKNQIDEFSKEWHVYSVDLRGHGCSPWVAGSTIHDFYGDLKEFVASLPGPVSLVAHSFGGYLCTRLAAEHPELVQRLCLLNTSGNIPKGIPYRLLQLLTPLANLVAAPERPIAAGTQVCQELLFGVLQDWNCWPYYPRIQVPVLMVLGLLDPLIPFISGMKASRKLANCRLEILPGGHVSMCENPKQVNGWIRNWLNTPTTSKSPV